MEYTEDGGKTWRPGNHQTFRRAGSLEATPVADSGRWRWTTDSPAERRTGSDLPDGTWRFTEMAPGWHITTRPAALMYDASEVAKGRYTIESTQILFPGTSQSGYGVFIGGRELAGRSAEYVAFLIRPDGHAMVTRRSPSGFAELVPWSAVSAIKRAADQQATASNTLRIAVTADSVAFSVNDVRVAALARGALNLDGHFGFRSGANLDMHITTLSYTRVLAPVPTRRRG
jgi:hypothetical protein